MRVLHCAPSSGRPEFARNPDRRARSSQQSPNRRRHSQRGHHHEFRSNILPRRCRQTRLARRKAGGLRSLRIHPSPFESPTSNRMKNILIKLQRDEELARFLESNGFTVDDLSTNVLRVQREDELPVFLKVDDKQIYFEVDLGNIDSIISQDLLVSLLALNTEILPVSIGLDTSNPDDRRLVLVESRETGDLSDQELLAVFDALELAVDRATETLAPSFNS
ncbi:MAG: hypothetical protein CAK90_07765 [Spartobacteria bacterium AMD-G4]|nr:MAG: hypothetical protein CAK90_07765 [Spartobacteria bacterium AMD-G4]